MKSTTTTKDSHQVEDQAAKRKKKKTSSFIFFIILFILIIVSIILVLIALKQEIDSESLSVSDPEEAIKAVCDLTPFPTLCFNPIWTLQRNISNKINITPSRIFAFSLKASLHQLLDADSANRMAISKLRKGSRNLSVLESCDGLIRDSIRLMNRSITTMGSDPDDKFFKIVNSVRDLNEWTSKSTLNMNGCLAALDDDRVGLKNGRLDFWKLKRKILNARNYVENSSAILAKMNRILGMFNQPIFAGIITEYYYGLFARFEDSGFGKVLYCSQYLVLVVFFCVVLRL